MRRHVEVNHTPAVMSQHDQDKQDAKGSRRNREEIHRDQIPDMIVQESPPRLGGRLPVLGHQSGNRALGDRDAQLQQLAMNPGRSPKRVGGGHLSYQVSHLATGFGAADAFSPRNPTPEEAETLAMPGHYGPWFDDD